MFKIKTGSYLFNNNTECTDISTANIDTSECTNMEDMFSYCMGLTSLNASKWNTSQVTDMSYMFRSCSNLASLDLSNWDTSQVTNTNSMFLACDSLKTVKMTNCSQATKDKIRAALDAAGLTSVVITE